MHNIDKNGIPLQKKRRECIYLKGDRQNTKRKMDKNEKSLVNQFEGNVVRKIIFAVCVVMLFLFYGMKVYASDAITMEQGTSKDVLTSNPNYSAPPEMYVEPADQGVTVSIDYYHDGSVNRLTEVMVTVAADAQPGTYEIMSSSLYNFINSDFVYATIVVVGPAASADKKTSAPATEAPKEVYVPKTEAEVYQELLTEQFPGGHQLLSVGDSECMNVVSPDKTECSFWHAGVPVAEFSFVDTDGAARKMIMQGTRTIDRVSYPSFWVNVNDGKGAILQLTEEQKQALLALGIKGIVLNEKLILFEA